MPSANNHFTLAASDKVQISNNNNNNNNSKQCQTQKIQNEHINPRIHSPGSSSLSSDKLDEEVDTFASIGTEAEFHQTAVHFTNHMANSTIRDIQRVVI